MLSFFKKASSSTSTPSAVHATSAASKGFYIKPSAPFTILPKAKPTYAVVNSAAAATITPLVKNEAFVPPKPARKPAYSLDTSMPVVLDALHDISKNVLFFARVFMGDFPNFVPEVMQIEDHESLIASVHDKADEVGQEIDFTNYDGQQIQRIKGVDMSDSELLATAKHFFARPNHRVARYLHTLDNNESAGHSKPKVSIQGTPVVSEYLTIFPANTVEPFSKEASTSHGGVLKQSTVFSEPAKPEWHTVNFPFFEKVALKTFDAIETDTTLSADELVHRLKILYRVLGKEMVEKVKSNFFVGGQKMMDLTTRISSIHAEARASFMELDCINEDYMGGENRSTISTRLDACLKKLDDARTDLSNYKFELSSGFRGCRQASMLADVKECLRISKMVTARHFDLTENVVDSEGAFFGDCGQSAYRSALKVLRKVAPDVDDVFSTDLLFATVEAASKTSRLVRSLKKDAEELKSLL
ncbi:hypothetical protein FT663_03560 [Candidozyma haemuli var. vulneris]|uniref:Uncharacterized protein n=1 Tax=Candidozyma haemuli TaxID=45357 RepID=A0A2V1AZV4_9ASCO|nr:hypothetical protein CXQ85_003126 [[Candida] haemuloni]KAF3988597.1 hypothetical protein FT662_03342 [[Candida] haemuloni var. vulneris]KAF3989616.1 hypothetical protein FT663_03560 [[Candida] haemuloni var. vulneris]PVH23392.1 hypothetical protein CXQ85_003126 [[Candida] haemuloni]